MARCAVSAPLSPELPFILNGEKTMRKILPQLFILTLLSSTAGIVAAQQLTPEQMIKNRKAGYEFMAWNMGKIKAQVVEAPNTYNKDQVMAAARTIASIANSGMGALYGPGTDKDAGSEKTRLKSEFFLPQNQDEVKKIATAFTGAANELEKVAETGNVDAIKAQFGKTGEACKACHDKFRKDK